MKKKGRHSQETILIADEKERKTQTQLDRKYLNSGTIDAIGVYRRIEVMLET